MLIKTLHSCQVGLTNANVTVTGPADAVLGHGFTFHLSYTDACPFVEVGMWIYTVHVADPIAIAGIPSMVQG